MMTTSLHMVPSGAIIFNIKVTNIKHLKNVYVAAFPVFVCFAEGLAKDYE